MNQSAFTQRISEICRALYGDAQGPPTAEQLLDLASRTRASLPEPGGSGMSRGSSTGSGPEPGLPLDQSDALLICYGDSVLEGSSDNQAASSRLGAGGGIEADGRLLPSDRGGTPPLQTLLRFARKELDGIIGGIHILPFFPYSSDDGFSVVDYFEVNPALGSWEDIRETDRNFRLMADLVINHCSAKGPWFKAWLAGDPDYRDFFIQLPPETELSRVVRPRTHPLLTPFKFPDEDGQTRHVWTTFSGDQVDLNFGNPKVLLKMTEVLFFLVSQGVQIIRLDAIAYLWKETGTSCIHLEKTHLVVKLLRSLLDEVAPWCVLITETNVPHRENLSYFGNGRDEAHLVYQFSLPPLLLDAFRRGSADRLAAWAASIAAGPPGPIGLHCSYFNFCASHDGIGVTPAHGILSEEELEDLYRMVEARGGRISYKATEKGPVPYELNISYFTAIAEKDLPPDLRIRKFMASQHILLSLPGVPGIYIHSLLGSDSWEDGARLSGANRTINREKLFYDELMKELADPSSVRAGVLAAWKRLLSIRRSRSAFHPAAPHKILETGSPGIFAMIRQGGDGREQSILCLTNCSAAPAAAVLPGIFTRDGLLGTPSGDNPARLHDLISGQYFDIPARDGGDGEIHLAPWEYLWLERSDPSRARADKHDSHNKKRSST